MSQPDTGAPAGIGLEFLASIDAQIGQLTEQAAYQRTRQGTLADSVSYISHITAPVPNAAGIIKADDVLGPKTGQAWEIRRMTAANFTAGTVAVYLDSHQAPQNQLVAFTQAGTFFFGGGQLIISAGDQLVVNASAATGTVFFSIGVVQVAQPWLAEYLL